MLFILRRVLSTVPVLLIVALIVFAMLRLTPGDPAAALVGNNSNSEDIARICHAHPSLSEATKEAALAVDKRTLNF